MFLIEFRLNKNNRKNFVETLFGRINKRDKNVYYKFGILGEIKAKLEGNKIYTEDDFTEIILINEFLTENAIWKITEIKDMKLESADLTLKNKINKLKKKGFKIIKGRRFWVEKAED